MGRGGSPAGCRALAFLLACNALWVAESTELKIMADQGGGSRATIEFIDEPGMAATLTGPATLRVSARQRIW